MADSTPSITASKSHNVYLTAHKESHIRNHEWRTAENSSAYLLPKLQAMIMEKPALRLLDCGAGPGTITLSLAKYIPQGEVIATDLSAEVMQRAQAMAISKGVNNMKCMAASIYDLPFPDESFDVVHAQQVLCHLDAPLEALQSMLRVCKPGGVVALRESDLRMWTVHPEYPGVLEFHKVQMSVMDAAGGTNTLGPRLVSLAMEAGIARDSISASMGTWCYSTREEREIWGGSMSARIRNGELRKKVIDAKLGWSAEELDAMADDWDRWVDAADGCFGSMHGEVIITKS